MRVDDCRPPSPPPVCKPSCPPLHDGVFNNPRIVVECGCITEIRDGEPFIFRPDPCCSTSGGSDGGGSSINVVQSPTLNLMGDGATNPLSGNVRVSSDTGNMLIVRPNGLFIAEPTIKATISIDTTSPSVTLSGDGSSTYPLRAVARLDPAVDNALKSTPVGLRVDPVQVRFSSQAANIIQNGADGNPGAFIEKEEMWESSAPAYLVGFGTTLQKLGVRLSLSGDMLNGLEQRFVLDSENRSIPTLFAQRETSELGLASGVGVNNANIPPGVFIFNIRNGRRIWIGGAQGTPVSGGYPRPTVTVTGPSSNYNVSGFGTITANSLTSTGTVTNMTPFYVDIPLPMGTTWRFIEAHAQSASTQVIRAEISGSNMRIYCFEYATSVPSANKLFLVTLIGFDPAIGEFIA